MLNPVNATTTRSPVNTTTTTIPPLTAPAAPSAEARRHLPIEDWENIARFLYDPDCITLTQTCRNACSGTLQNIAARSYANLAYYMRNGSPAITSLLLNQTQTPSNIIMDYCGTKKIDDYRYEFMLSQTSGGPDHNASCPGGDYCTEHTPVGAEHNNSCPVYGYCTEHTTELKKLLMQYFPVQFSAHRALSSGRFHQVHDTAIWRSLQNCDLFVPFQYAVHHDSRSIARLFMQQSFFDCATSFNNLNQLFRDGAETRNQRTMNCVLDLFIHMRRGTDSNECISLAFRTAARHGHAAIMQRMIQVVLDRIRPEAFGWALNQAAASGYPEPTNVLLTHCLSRIDNTHLNYAYNCAKGRVLTVFSQYTLGNRLDPINQRRAEIAINVHAESDEAPNTTATHSCTIA